MVTAMRQAISADPISGGPFDLSTQQAYLKWREEKRRTCPESPDALRVMIANPRELSQSEREAILSHCRSINMAIYSINGESCSKADLVRFGHQLGLNRLDGNLCADEDKITSLQVVESGRHTTYIPYTNKIHLGK